jgi:triphosphoribosyl-dephospho-CoA synthase
LTGVRGEAASGFSTVRNHALPAFEKMLFREGSEEKALHEALLYLLAVNHDTNLVHRGGLAALAHVQSRALSLIETGGVQSSDFKARMLDFDSDLIARNLSPGGSADLLAVTWFLSRFPSPKLSCH